MDGGYFGFDNIRTGGRWFESIRSDHFDLERLKDEAWSIGKAPGCYPGSCRFESCRLSQVRESRVAQQKSRCL